MGEDVAIIGAGIVGCATAYFLAREGMAVKVLDPGGIAGGASGRNNGLIEHPYDAVTVALFDETVGFLQEALGSAMPSHPVGTLLVAETESDAQAIAAHYAGFPELRPQLLTPTQAGVAEPLLAPDLWGCMLDTGYPISPADATRAVAELARRAGAEFVLPARPVTRTQGLRIGRTEATGTGVSKGEGIENNRDVIFDPLGLETWQADAIVVAAGAGTPSVLEGLLAADAVAPLWGVIVSVELPRPPRHPLIEGALAAAQGGAEHVPEAPFTLLPSPSYLAVGSTMLPGREPDGAEWAPRLLDRGARFVPSIAQARVQGELVCARPRSFDNRPILGRVPGQERLWIASGHGGRGMSLGAASGRLLAEAILAGSDAAIAPELSARRLSARACQPETRLPTLAPPTSASTDSA